jgi:hypothetical protein
MIERVNSIRFLLIFCKCPRAKSYFLGIYFILSFFKVSLIGNFSFWSRIIKDFDVESIVGLILMVSTVFVGGVSTGKLSILLSCLLLKVFSSLSVFKYLSKVPALKAMKLVRRITNPQSVKVFTVLCFFMLQNLVGYDRPTILTNIFFKVLIINTNFAVSQSSFYASS